MRRRLRRLTTVDGRERLAQRQAELVAALVAGGAVPDGFDEARVRATENALLRKRAGEVAARWPNLRAQFGPEWSTVFADWARGRAPHGSWRDGWDLARRLAASGDLRAAGAAELAVAEATYIYDGQAAPRPRRGPALRRVAGVTALRVAGRVLTWP